MPIHDLVRQRLHPLTSLVTSNRIFVYCLLGVLALVGTIVNACRNYSNFYSVTIYLSKSSRSVVVLANTGCLLALGSGRLLQQLFFGPLQTREVERLYDQTWIFITESLLAFTIFRDDFDIPFVIMFGFLLFVKCFHWLLADRVETMDQTTYPGPSLLFHIRINTLFILLWVVDIMMFAFAVESTLTHGVSGMVLFASEYAILMASALNSMARYILSVIDYRRARNRGGENAPPMENKSMYIFYIELCTDFLKLTTYLTFFMLILTFYGLPLNIVRDVYLTARSFITRLRALIRYHNATRDMDRRYPDATEAELSEMSDRTCIICREEMHTRNAQPQTGEENADGQAPNYADGPNMTAKKLPCGHIFHFQCLRSWLERQQSCPTCRRTVLETNDQNQGPARGRQAGPRAAAAPQPGAVPQAGQVPAAAWLNNFLGVQPQAPGVQGQVGNAQAAQPGPAQIPPHNFGWPPALAPWYYQPPPQLLPAQPVPPFRGFYGPGGVWQPWGVDPHGHQRQGQGQVPATDQPVDQAPSTSTDHLPPAQAEPVAERPMPPPTSTASASTSATEQPSTPRHAAAQAALRRLGHLHPQSSYDTAASHASTSSAGSQPAMPASDTQSSQSMGSEPSRSANTQPEVPSLIPLYDFSARPSPFTLSHNPYGAHHASYFRTPSQVQPPPGASLSSQFHQGNTRSARSSGTSASPRAPLAQLPATLSDEQLARLDRVTREAIDERLRVLEGVSGAVYRCVEELTRVRSVLPAPVQFGPADATQEQSRRAEVSTGQTTPGGGSVIPGGQHDAVGGSSNGATPASTMGPSQTQAPASLESGVQQ